MNASTVVIRTILGVFFLVAAAAPEGTMVPAEAASATQPAGAATSATAQAGGDLQAFQLVSPGAGWVLMGQNLFWTDNNGKDWRDMTPPELGAATIRAASFTDAAQGWAVTTAPSPTDELNYSLARTVDGGRTWQSHALELFAANDEAGMAGDVSLQFIDSKTGWLVVKQATSSNFDLGTLFRTNDGGATWTRLSLPVGEPVHFTSALDGEQDASATGRGRYLTHDGGQTWMVEPAGSVAPTSAGNISLSALSMATARDGWAKSAVGQCQAGSCVLVTKLLDTQNGGQTWTPVSLPSGQTSLEQSFAAPSAPAAPQDAGGLRVTYTGQGFDFCDPKNGLPAFADMQTWYTSSPYRVWGIYLGGSSNHGLCGTLTDTYLRQLARQGWLFIPTWVGPQAPCTSYSSRMSWDVTTAYNQGVAEADLAQNTAKGLGLTLSDGSGTVIYYDVEYFNDSSDQSCLAAVQAFISGWSGELRAKGNQAGVYGAQCGQQLSAFAAIPNVPDMVWNARWMLNPAYNPNASLWGVTYCGFADTLWTNHQRMRQYAGGHNETWDNVTFNIDSDVIDANVARVLVNCVPTWGQVGIFQYPSFGGQCVLKGLGDYPTAASLGLPFSSIGSLAVGPYMTAMLCQGAFFTGTCQSFPNDITDLGSQPVGTNPISSMRITTSLALPNHYYFPAVLSH